MARFFLALLGVILLSVTALALVWLLGQVLVGVGAFVVGAAGVLGRLLWFLVFTGVLSGLVYFVASAWRPSSRGLAPAQKRIAPRPAVGGLATGPGLPTGSSSVPANAVQAAPAPASSAPGGQEPAPSDG